MIRCTASCLLMCVSLIATCSWAQAQSISGRRLQDITPPDVFAHVSLVRAELEDLRAYMGRPKDQSPEFPVSEAEPREVFFQALTLFRKANRMSFEQTRTREPEPAPPETKIMPGHVYAAVDQALQRIQSVKKKLRLDRQVDKDLPDPSKTPSDVFRSIVHANRQLNLLLERQFSPSDVFQQVTVAIAYTERLIEQFPGANSTVPTAPEFETNKVPGDVYRRLLGCFDKVQLITARSGRQVLKLGDVDDMEISRAAPSDVYDVASLVVSELAFVHAELPDAARPRKAYFPGRKFPSDVFQRVGILEKQLDQLAELVERNPEWLGGVRRDSPPEASE